MESSDRKTIIITGSSSGIGAAVARLAARHNHNLVINYNSNAEGAENVAEICRTEGVEVVIVQADISKDADCKRLAQAAIDQWGRIDVLVNNAGTTRMVSHDDLDGLDSDDFTNLYQTNTVGAFQMIRAVVPTMKQTGGRIVNVASVAGMIGVGSSVAYACSKGAMLALNKSMARVLGPEIVVNAVCPGFVEGQWLQEGLGEEMYGFVKQHYETQARTNQVMNNETVAENIWYFASTSQNITGEHLLMDGGATLPY